MGKGAGSLPPPIFAPSPHFRYFNTFGGNPVAGRVALATLDVLVKSDLQANAAAVGEVLLAGFRGLAAKYPALVGSVRGVGLMVGIECLRDAADPRRQPWTEAASAIVLEMRRRRILLSTDGMASNIIKLKPPMVFTASDANRVIGELDDVMSHLDEHIESYRAAP